LCIGDELGDGARGEIRPQHQRIRDRGHDGERLEGGGIEIELGVKQHIGRERCRLRREQGVPVGCGHSDRLGAEISAGAEPVFHHERLAPHPGEALCNHACRNIEAAAGRRRDDDLDGALRVM
jgi:hypothetical protein